MHIEQNMALISINATMLAQVASFLLFLFFMNRLAFKPLKAKMQEREEKILRLNVEMKDMQAEMKSLSAEMAKQETAARTKARSLVSKMKEEGQKEAATALAESMDRIAGIRNAAAQRIGAEMAEARKSLDKEAEAISQGIAEKVLGRRLS